MMYVMAVTLIVWLGLFAYLWNLSRKVEALKKEIDRS